MLFSWFPLESRLGYAMGLDLFCCGEIARRSFLVVGFVTWFFGGSLAACLLAVQYGSDFLWPSLCLKSSQDKFVASN